MSTTQTDISKKTITAARRLSRAAGKLDFSPYAPWVYNPLDYAWKAHEQYLSRFARPSCRVLLLGMNPGPWGMAQTGVPFGEVTAVTEWLRIDAPIKKPVSEHPKRPIEGLRCQRSEVSGRRLWGLFSERYPSPDDFFGEHFVANYCPLVFMEESARNITPDKLPTGIRQSLETVCDDHLATLIQLLTPEWVIGVGAFAEACARRATERVSAIEFQVGRILHPSPASPAANRDWAGTATRQLVQLGVWRD